MDIEYQIRSVLSGNLVYKSTCREEVTQKLNKRNPSTYEVYWVTPRSGRVRAISAGSSFAKQVRGTSAKNGIQTSLIDK